MLCNASEQVLGKLTGGTNSPDDALIEGPGFKMNMLLEKLPKLRSDRYDAAEAEAAAYGAPFPDEKSKAGVRRFPELVMVEPGMDGIEISKKAADFFKNSWTGECFMPVGVAYPVIGLPVMTKLNAGIRGASELMILEEAGHFVQEWGEPIAQAALDNFTG